MRDFKFYYVDGENYVSVLTPIGVVFMASGSDNRPYEAIVEDIKAAMKLLEEVLPDHNYDLYYYQFMLPELLGYKPATANFKRI